MARLRKGVAYRRIERPYTRKSKYNQLSFIKGVPHLKISRFTMGNPNGNYKYVVKLISKDDAQVRQEALESARKTANKKLEKSLGKNYFFRIRKYPHHVLRENPLATGAGADRLSTGMKLAFGKPIGIAAQVFQGDIIMEVFTPNEDSAKIAKEALKRAIHKMPISATIKIEEINPETAL